MQSDAHWKARHAEVCAADGDEWDRFSEAYDAEWKATYCAAFRRFAAERKWTTESIESGWLDQMPDDALWSCEPGADPVQCARLDVLACETEADNAE